MLSEKMCIEFVVGKCTKELFAVEGITKRCKYKHDNEEKENYEEKMKKESFDFEKEVFFKYTQIVQECNRKILNNKKVLTKLNSFDKKESIEKALDSIENTLNSNVNRISDQCYFYALKSHGDIILKLINESKASTKKYSVCEVCFSFLVSDEKCNHQFCSAYAYLRKRTKELYLKVYKQNV